MDKFTEMGKVELRAACKEAGISYGKLNNDGMREALRAASTPDLAALGEFGIGTEEAPKCPHCGIDHISNGMLRADDEAANDTRTLWEAGQQNSEYSCMGCGGEWGPVRAPYVAPKQVDRHTGSGLKIEKVREERNGVKRPSAGGKCRMVWDALDAYRAEIGELPTVAVVKLIAADEGWNVSNATIEFYQWRKFNGIKGR